MATVQDLLDSIAAKFDVAELIDRGTTADGKIHEYDLWYRQNSIIFYKRLSIYVHGDEAEWYGSNPIPSDPVPTFSQRVENKIANIIETSADIKYLAIDSVNDFIKRAIIVGYRDVDGTITEFRAYIWEDAEGKLQYAMI